MDTEDGVVGAPLISTASPRQSTPTPTPAMFTTYWPASWFPTVTVTAQQPVVTTAVVTYYHSGGIDTVTVTWTKVPASSMTAAVAGGLGLDSTGTEAGLKMPAATITGITVAGSVVVAVVATVVFYLLRYRISAWYRNAAGRLVGRSRRLGCRRIADEEEGGVRVVADSKMDVDPYIMHGAAAGMSRSLRMTRMTRLGLRGRLTKLRSSRTKDPGDGLQQRSLAAQQKSDFSPAFLVLWHHTTTAARGPPQARQAHQHR